MSTQSSPPGPQHAPYPPPVANLGGIPTKNLDDPITAVFLFLFVLGAAAHMTILQVNMRRGHKFIISALLFGFCMARITTCTMRLVFISYPHNVSIAIAAQIFVAAGVLLLFIINLIFTQRVIRARHPLWAWSKAFSLAFKIYYVSIVLLLIALIFCTVQAFYTLDTNIRRIDRDIQLLGGTYFAVAAFLPFPLLALNFLIPRPKANPSTDFHRVDKFGTGRYRTKIYILLLSSALLTFGAAFRAGTAYLPRPRNDPAWYHSKACFYLVNFTVEILVVALYVVIRVDKRFYVPDGSKGPGDYQGRKEGDEVVREEGFLGRINSEEEAFGGGEVREKNADVDVEMGGKGLSTSQRSGTGELEKPEGVPVIRDDLRFSRVPTLKTSDEVERNVSSEVQISVGQTPVEQAPVEQISAEQAPIEQIAVEPTPVEQTQTPVEQSQVEQTPVEQTPAKQVPIEQIAVEQSAAEQTPVNQNLAEQTPVEQISVEQGAVEQSAVKQSPNSIEQTPTPVEHTPVEPTQNPVEQTLPQIEK
ncbi:hypothetical protein VTL71DRAFT_2440 [Oculimacula yallundae]|uniref:Uncharacterized protein n=1 Tax=Oculimacula yallundae TaxID=86028 RepID=A0ABR4C8W1_9HELO